MESYFKTKSLFQLIFKWKWHILIIMVVAGAIGIFVSSPMVMQPKFKSSAVLYPANVFPFSEESETEQMLEIMQSLDTRDKVFTAFNLAEHYKIDTNNPHYKTILNRAFESNVTFQKTPNEAVKITVLDVDPIIASNIVDSLIVFYSKKLRQMGHQKSSEVVVIHKNEMVKKTHEIDSLTEVVDHYRIEYNMLDNKSQIEIYSEAIKDGKNLKEARSILNSWKEMGSDYRKTDSLLWYAMTDYHLSKKAFEEAIMHSEKHLTYAHVVTHPFPADKKTWPVRWLIVLLSIAGAFFSSVLVIAIIESRKAKNDNIAE